MRLGDLKKRNMDKNLKYILIYKKSENCTRWISARGWVLQRNEMRIVYSTPMGGEIEEPVALVFDTRRQSIHVAAQLNSEIVRIHEPDLWYNGIWYNTYIETHPKHLKQLLSILSILRNVYGQTIKQNPQVRDLYNSGASLLLNPLLPQDLFLLLKLSQVPGIIPEERLRLVFADTCRNLLPKNVRLNVR